jgi:hypothetical protein
MLECASPAETRNLLETSPLVRTDLIDFEIIPLRSYPGFARLFAEAS